jgi:hypothetical protein
MKLCVKRILENYNTLKLYFTTVAFEDPMHTNDAILPLRKFPIGIPIGKIPIRI